MNKRGAKQLPRFRKRTERIRSILDVTDAEFRYVYSLFCEKVEKSNNPDLYCSENSLRNKINEKQGWFTEDQLKIVEDIADELAHEQYKGLESILN